MQLILHDYKLKLININYKCQLATTPDSKATLAQSWPSAQVQTCQPHPCQKGDGYNN